MSFLTTTDRWWLAALRSALDDAAPPVPPDDLDWSRLIQTARRHNLLPLTAAALARSGHAVPENVQKTLDEAGNQALYIEANRDYELETLFAAFSDARIEFLPLKGTVLKRYYPSPELRTMDDVDVLIRKETFGATEKILRQNGYAFLQAGLRHHIYSKPPLLTIELHHSLLDGDEKSRQKSLFDRFLPERLWERLPEVSPASTERRMAPDDFYLYQLLHLRTHFLASGVGVRFFLDMEILRRHEHIAALPELAVEPLREGNLEQFASEVDRLSRYWFAPERVEPPCAELEEFVFSGGTLGSRRQLAASRIGTLSPKGGAGAKFRLLLQKGFPSHKKLLPLYPALDRFAVLLPLCWIHLNFRRLFVKRRVYLPYLKAVLDAAPSETERLDAFYRRIGLEPLKGARRTPE